jgi:YHS domain-containing protein
MQYKDPVCGMTVDSASSVDSADGRHHFCSTTCRDQFEANPDQFMGATRANAGEQLEKHEPPRTHKPITAPKFGSSTSGGGEFDLPPEQHRDEP